jgi:hypothetical protein
VVKSVGKKGASMYFWSETREWNMAKKYNYELYETFNKTNIVTYIEVKRLAWAVNLVIMNSNRTVKKIFNPKPDGVRSVGRPKLQWEDGVDQNMRILGVKNWKKVALKKDKSAKLLKKARAHPGAVKPMMMMMMMK